MVKSLRVLGTFFLGILLLSCSFLVIFFHNQHQLLPWSNNTNWLEQYIEHAIQQPVHIDQVTMYWSGLQPVAEIHGFAINNDKGAPSLYIKRLNFNINLLMSIFKWKLVPADFELEGTHLIFTEENLPGKIDINHIPALQADLFDKNSKKLAYLISCFLSSGTKKIKDVDISWYDSNGKQLFTINHLNFIEKGHFFSREFNSHGTWERTPFFFSGQTYGNALMQKMLYTKLNFITKDIDLFQNPIIDRLATNLKITKGGASIVGSLSLTPSHCLNLNADLRASHIIVWPNNHNFFLPIEHLQTHLSYILEKNTHHLSLNNLQLFIGNHLLPVHELHFKQITNNENSIQTLRINSLALAPMSSFALNYPLLPEKYLALIKKLQLSGQVNDLFLENDSKHKQDLIFKGRLVGVSFLPWKNFPGMSNLSGALNGSLKEGSFALDSNDVLCTYQPLFPLPISIKKVIGEINWHKDKLGNWLVKLKNAKLDTNDLNTIGGMDIYLPKALTNPYVNARFTFNISNIGKVGNYYPSLIPKNVLAWLKQSILEGKISDGLFILKGNMHDFPFDRAKGKFQISANLDHGRLHYKNHWPSLDDLRAKLLFEGRSMLITSDHAEVLGAKLHYLQAKIKNLGQALLLINGQLSTHSLQHVELAVADNPLLLFFNYPKLETGKISGKWQLALNLSLPLDKSSKKGIHYNGDIKFFNTDLDLSNANLTVDNLQGRLFFNENSAASSLLTGSVNNNLFRLTIDRIQSPLGTATNFFWKSSMDVNDVRKFYNKHFLSYLQGKTTYQGKLELFKSAGGGLTSNLQIASDLIGIKSLLPRPFDKPAQMSIPSSLKITRLNANKTVIYNYGEVISGMLSYQLFNNSLAFNYGYLFLGNPHTKMPATSGLTIAGTLAELNLPKWQEVFQEPGKIKTSFNNQLKQLPLIHHIAVNINHLQINNNLSFPNISVSALSKEDSIAVLLNSPDVRGEIQLPKPHLDLPLKFNLDFLKISGNHDQLKNNLSPNDFSAVDLFISHLTYKDKTFENFALKLRPHENDLLIKQLSLKDPNCRISASGIWRKNKGMQETTLTGNMATQDLGGLLSRWKITDNMVKGEGSSSFNFTWKNSPIDFKINKLDGMMNLSFSQGRIIKLSSQANLGMGMGRVLSLFSLQTLPRRLMLDFSDLTEPGFSFDQMKGSLQFKQGNIYTEDAFIDGPVAKVIIKGRIGLANKDYNLRLVINPYVTSSLPVVATLTAGPIVGAATWLVDKVFSRQVKHMTEIHYNITGTWDNPTMHNLTENHK